MLALVLEAKNILSPWESPSNTLSTKLYLHRDSIHNKIAVGYNLWVTTWFLGWFLYESLNNLVAYEGDRSNRNAVGIVG